MTGPAGAPEGGGGRRPPTPAEKLRRAVVGLPVLALACAVLWGFPLFAWWRAQVTDKHGTGAKAFSVGDPFPWILLVLGVVCVVACLAVWVWMLVRLRRLRDGRAPAGPAEPVDGRTGRTSS